MLGVFAEFETNLRRERQLEDIAAAKVRGAYNGPKMRPESAGSDHRAWALPRSPVSWGLVAPPSIGLWPGPMAEGGRKRIPPEAADQPAPPPRHAAATEPRTHNASAERHQSLRRFPRHAADLPAPRPLTPQAREPLLYCRFWRFVGGLSRGKIDCFAVLAMTESAGQREHRCTWPAASRVICLERRLSTIHSSRRGKRLR